jgi:thiol-disulfide isomerase/thioredoxin
MQKVKPLALITALLLTVPLLSLSACSGGGSSTTEESFVVGSGAQTFIKKGSRVQAPPLSSMTLTGVNYTLEPGKIAVINVWASWCSPCRAEAPTLVALSEKYPDVPFVGILTRDNLVNAEAFVRTKNITYPTLIDDALLIGFSKSLPANAIPSTIVIDRDGFVAARVSGIVTMGSLSALIERVQSE